MDSMAFNFIRKYTKLANLGAGNSIFLIGICLGVTFGIALIPFLSLECDSKQANSKLELGQLDSPILHRTRRDIQIKAPMQPLFQRPRYASTELGLRKKLLVAIVTTSLDLPWRLVRINQTLAHLVEKLLIFVYGTSKELKKLRALGLANVIPIETVKSRVINETQPLEDKLAAYYTAIQGIQYIGDKFANSFDYFWIGLDEYYVSGRNLEEALRLVSVRHHVLWGVPDSSGFCELAPGFVMSRSILLQIQNKLSSCWVSSGNQTLGADILECFRYSYSNLACQRSIQEQIYNVADFPTEQSSMTFTWNSEAIVVGPVFSPDDILKIHQAFCQSRKLKIDSEIANFQRVLTTLQNKIPNEGQDELTWPIGMSPPIQPKTRFDLHRWTFFTSSVIYFQDASTTLTTTGQGSFPSMDSKDLEHIIQEGLKLLRIQFTNNHYEFVSGYKRFAPTRGMEYKLDFQNEETQERVRVEGVRPLLDSIEIVPVPFTTEAKYIIFVLPISRQNIAEFERFLNYWWKTSSDYRLKTTGLIIGILSADDALNDLASPLLNAEEEAQVSKLIDTYNNALKNEKSTKRKAPVFKIISSIVKIKANSHLNVALLDELGYRGLLGYESLIFMLETGIELTDDFLNRIRLNSIQGYQVFSPIPFVEYHTNVSHNNSTQELRLRKDSGYFNTRETRLMSFYYSDYIKARQKDATPLRMASLIDPTVLLNLFVLQSDLHIFRATDPNCHLRSSGRPLWRETDCLDDIDSCLDPLLGTRAQLAKIIIETGLT